MAAARPPRRFPIPISNAALADFAASMRDNLLNAAHNGDLRLLKRMYASRFCSLGAIRAAALVRGFWFYFDFIHAGLVRMLDEGVGNPRDVVEAARAARGIWVLQVAAGNGQMEVCRYLVQGLGVDVDAADDNGADPDKADESRISPLHSAAGIGDCKMIKLLLAKGAYVDPIANDMGTPLLLATKLRQVGAVRTLLEHNADPNKPYLMDDYLLYPMTPLFQAVNVASVECVKLLVEAGAVITSHCVTTVSLDSTMGNDGSTECLNFLMEACARREAPNDHKHADAWKIEQLKSFGSQAVQKKVTFQHQYSTPRQLILTLVTRSCSQTGAFARSDRAMGRWLCWMLLNAENCGLTGQRHATGTVPLCCHWRITGAHARHFWMDSSWIHRMPRWSMHCGKPWNL